MKLNIKSIRTALVSELIEYDGKPIDLSSLGYSKSEIQKILFDTYNTTIYDDLNEDKPYEEVRKEFAKELYPILKKIDFHNVSFKHFNCTRFDFSGFTGIKLNPQSVFFKRLSFATCNGVRFVGSFKNSFIEGANFAGSKGARINPQKIYWKSLIDTKCDSVKFVGPFDGVKLLNADLSGAKFIKVDKPKVRTLRYKDTI